MTRIISNNIYKYLDENDLLPMERKWSRGMIRETKDQLLTGKTILADCKKRHANLVMAWVNYWKQI